MGECVLAEPGKMGGIVTGCERKGDSTWKKSCKKGKMSAVWNPASGTQPSSVRASLMVSTVYCVVFLH